MANLLSDLVYTTLDDARDTSTVFDKQVKDAELTSYITNAQWVVDNYIGSYGTPFVEGQTFIFPVNVDDVSTIPVDIQIATIQISEYLYLQGDVTLSKLKGEKVASESNLSRSVTYDTKSGSFSKYIETIDIPTKTLNILDKYKSTFISRVI